MKYIAIASVAFLIGITACSSFVNYKGEQSNSVSSSQQAAKEITNKK